MVVVEPVGDVHPDRSQRLKSRHPYVGQLDTDSCSNVPTAAATHEKVIRRNQIRHCANLSTKCSTAPC